MSSDWRKIELSELAIINPKRVIPRGAEAPFIDMAALPTDSRDIDNTPRQRIFKGGGSRFMNGDTLLARITPCLENGKTAFVNNLKDNTIGHGSTEFIVLSSKDPEDRKFIYYLVRGEAFRSYAIARMEGTSGRQRVPTDAVAKYTFSCPPKSIRSEISNFLCLFDDRITLLRETNKTLESIAQAIFKSWFVDFDPVHAKAEGRAPEGMDEETAALFPDEFEEAKLGLVPKGWRMDSVSSLGEIICGKTPPTSDDENFGHDIPFITIPDMHDKLVITSTRRSLSKKGAKSQPSKFLPAGAVCVSCIATPGLVTLVTVPSQTNQQINSVIPKDSWGAPYTLFALKKIGHSIRAEGSGGSVFMNLSKSRFGAMPILLPSKDIAIKFNLIADSLINKIINNQYKINLLKTIRDHLLPRLISGKLRLPEAESLVEEVI